MTHEHRCGECDRTWTCGKETCRHEVKQCRRCEQLEQARDEWQAVREALKELGWE